MISLNNYYEQQAQSLYGNIYPQQNIYGYQNNPYQQQYIQYPQQYMQQQNNYITPGTIQDVITSGGFGYTSPQQQSNIIPIGGGYQSNNYQPTYYQQQKYDYYNPYGQPIQNGYNQYNPNNYYNILHQQQMQSPMYGYQQMYYNPYQQQYMTMISNIQKTNYDMNKIRAQIVCGSNFDQNKFDERFAPKVSQPRQMTKEEIQCADYERKINLYYNVPEMPCTREAYIMNLWSDEFSKKFDERNLYEFMCKDVVEMVYKMWVNDNFRDYGRDFSRLYDSNDYNQLLRFHRDNNDFIQDLARKKRLDPNSEEVEMGFDLLTQMLEQRKQDIRLGKFTNPLSDLVNNEDYQRRQKAFLDRCQEAVEKKKQMKAAQMLGVDV